MALGADAFDRVTDRIISILEADEDLQRLMGEKVSVEKGFWRMVPEPIALFVYRAGVKSFGYWEGQEGEDIFVPYAIICHVRHLGDPAGLETLLGRLVANVATVMLKHKGEAGYWITAQLGASQAVDFRDEQNQTHEMEVVPVLVRFQNAGD